MNHNKVSSSNEDEEEEGRRGKEREEKKDTSSLKILHIKQHDGERRMCALCCVERTNSNVTNRELYYPIDFLCRITGTG